MTPELYYYIALRQKHVDRVGKEPNYREQMEIFCRAKVEYNRLSLSEKLLVERHVDMLNDINFVENRKKQKSNR